MKVKLLSGLLVLALLLGGCAGTPLTEKNPLLTDPAELAVPETSEQGTLPSTAPVTEPPESTKEQTETETVAVQTEPKTESTETTAAAETEPVTQPAETTPATEPKPTETTPVTEPKPTETVPPTTALPGGPTVTADSPEGFHTGYLVGAGGKVISSQPGGIYLCRQNDRKLICTVTGSEARQICTDGRILYYCDASGQVREVNVETGEIRVLNEALGGSCTVAGVLNRMIYVSCWRGDGWAPETYQVDRTNGKTTKDARTLEVSTIHGSTVLMGFRTDISASDAWIYNSDGEVILGGMKLWQVGCSDGALWYSAVDADYGDGKYADDQVHLYRYNGKTWVKVYEGLLMGQSDFNGARLIGDYMLVYSASGLGAWRVKDGTAADQVVTNQLSYMTTSVVVDGVRYYLGQSSVLRQETDGSLSVAATPQLGQTWVDALLADGLYVRLGDGTVSWFDIL